MAQMPWINTFCQRIVDIRPCHVHTHYLLQQSIAFALHLDMQQVEVIRIQKISNGLAISAKLKCINAEYAVTIRSDMATEGGDVEVDLRAECIKHLKFETGQHVLLKNLKVADSGVSQMVTTKTNEGTSE